MAVRRFIERDRDGLRDLYIEYRRSAFSWLDSESLNLSDLDRDTEGEEIWVAEIEGSVVGFVSVFEAESFIHNLFVRPGWFGRVLLVVIVGERIIKAITPTRVGKPELPGLLKTIRVYERSAPGYWSLSDAFSTALCHPVEDQRAIYVCSEVPTGLTLNRFPPGELPTRFSRLRSRCSAQDC